MVAGSEVSIGQRVGGSVRPLPATGVHIACTAKRICRPIFRPSGTRPMEPVPKMSGSGPCRRFGQLSSIFANIQLRAACADRTLVQCAERPEQSEAAAGGQCADPRLRSGRNAARQVATAARGGPGDPGARPQTASPNCRSFCPKHRSGGGGLAGCRQ